MPVHSRNVLLFLALAATAVLTWMLARNTEQESNGPRNDPGRNARGYDMRGAVLYGTDDDGAMAVRIDAERLNQESSESDFSLEEVRVEYAGESGVVWRLTAVRGELSPDRELLDLQSVGLRAESNRDGVSLVFQARELSLDLGARKAGTSQPVSLRNGQCDSTARGLNVDLNADTFELLEAVTVCRPRASPVLALAVLATGVAAQEEPPTGQTYTYECSSSSGNLQTNEHTCRDAVITDRGSFRLTAGLATVVDERRMTFEQSEWRLTEGVRLEFETAVMTADSAVFIFDAAGMLQSFDMTGMPAELADYVATQSTPVRVRASRIVYDRESGTLKMPGQVEFVDDGDKGNSANACDLTYWLEEKTYEIGNPQCGARLSLAPPPAKDSEVTIIDEP